MTSVAALHSDAAKEVCDALYSFGELLGMVIHIGDDVSAASARTCLSQAASALVALERLLGEPAVAGLGVLLPRALGRDVPGMAW
jgi:hypothetical protein